MNSLKVIPFLRVLPSQANYFLCEVLPPYTSRVLTEIMLEKYNILLKDCSGKNAMKNRDYIRIAVRDTNDNEALVTAFKQL